MKKSKRTSLKAILFLLAFILLSLFAAKTLFEAGEFDTIWDHPLADVRFNRERAITTESRSLRNDGTDDAHFRLS